jgi:competence protein CoiA
LASSAREQAKHEQMRRRQDERKRAWQEQQEELERQREQQRAEEERRWQEAEAARQARDQRHRQLRLDHLLRQSGLDGLVRRGRRAVERIRAEHELEQLRLQEQEAQRRLQEQQAADLAAGRAWWGLLSAQQRTGLEEAVAATAWKELTLRAEIRTTEIWPQYAYGKVARVGGRRLDVFAILRPCPQLVGRCPELHQHRVFVRNAREAQLLVDAGLDAARITHLDLPDFEQTALC